MSSVKDRMAEIIQEQPEDATYGEIMRELAFERMVERGLADSRTGRVISNEEMARRIRSIAYLIKGSDRVDIIGVFHGALDIDLYLP
jgi:predicted transcriptional regulator